MGVLNVTPDSFSDGGRWLDADAAIAHGITLRDQGAEIVDVGGESTRPGADPVDEAEEQRRILPVIRGLADAKVRVSVDTRNWRTAEKALGAGAQIVNDVLGDDEMLALVAQAACPYVMMHNRGPANAPAEYRDVVADVRDELARKVDLLIDRGADPAQVILDPGLGFAKNADHNWELLRNLAALEALHYPVLVGASRKRFLGALLPDDASMSDRDLPTAVVTALAARAGVWGVRVHDIPSSRTALDVVAHWTDGGTR